MDLVSHAYTSAVALNNAGIALLERGRNDCAAKCFQDATVAIRLSLRRYEVENKTDGRSTHAAQDMERKDLERRVTAVSKTICSLGPKSQEPKCIQVLSDGEWDSTVTDLAQSLGAQDSDETPLMCVIHIEDAASSHDDKEFELESETTSAIILHNLGTTKLIQPIREKSEESYQNGMLNAAQKTLKTALKIVQETQTRCQRSNQEDSSLTRQAVCLASVLYSIVVLFSFIGASSEVEFYSRVLHNLTTSMNHYHATMGRFVRNRRVLCASAA